MQPRKSSPAANDVVVEPSLGLDQTSGYDDLDSYLEADGLNEGQRRRLGVFKTVEPGICARIESMCEEAGIEVTDIAVLVIAPQANGFFFEEGSGENGIHVILGHRDKIYEFLSETLPPAPDAPFDPYEDLKEMAPSRCVRVFILDDESLTVMSYGTFVTVRMDEKNIAQA